MRPEAARRPERDTPVGGTHERGAQSRRLRIIAGQWRGRRWQFPPGGIRPTSDRVRETLFNWLQGRIHGRCCLDLYAGSGALGLEALSRGAAHCVFVDQDGGAITALGDVLRQWGASTETVQLERSTAQQFLAKAVRAAAQGTVPLGTPRFDLVFLDPPFVGDELSHSVARLEACGYLSSGTLIYVEQPRVTRFTDFPASWLSCRSGTAGAVAYDLYERC